MRGSYACLLSLCACSEVLVPPDGGGGGGGEASTVTTVQTATSGETTNTGAGGTGGTGGSGGEEPERTIVVGLEMQEGTDANDIVVLVSAQDGTVSGTWLGGQLPVEAPVHDGDLVSYLYARPGESGARTFRVTPEVTEVHVQSWLVAPAAPPCDVGEPMTLILDIPVVDGANSYRFTFTTGVADTPIVSPVPGTYAREVRACPGITSFDVVLLVAEFANTDPLVFARLEDIPYAPGTTVSLPVTFSTERQLVDLIVEAEPGTTFVAIGGWQTQGLGPWGRFGVGTSLEQEVPESGIAALSYGPFALGPGDSSVRVKILPDPLFCGTESAWRRAPFDGTPLHVKAGVMAALEPAADGNVGIAPDGEVGDVMIRRLNRYDRPLAVWELNEDPLTPYPLPTPPEVPGALLPSFQWPSASAELEYIHLDVAPIEGYAEYARLNADGGDGRSRTGVAGPCP